MADLRITFAGLCLLVQDQAGGAMHALMPKIAGGHIHHPVLAFHDQNGKPQKESILGLHLELQGVTASNGFNAGIPLDVFHFGDPLLKERKVRRDLLDVSASLPGEVHTRVRLTTGRHDNTSRPGGFWNFEVQNTKVPRRMPTAVDWLIRGVVSSPVVIADTRVGKAFNLFPGEDGSIRVLIAHLTPDEYNRLEDVVLPEPNGCPPPQHPAKHFALFFPLLTPNDVLPAPKFDLALSKAAGVCRPKSALSSDVTQQRSAAAAGAAVAAGAAAVVAAAAAINPAAPGAAAAAAAAALAAAQAAEALSGAGSDESSLDRIAARVECGDHQADTGHAGQAAAAPVAAAAAGSDLTCMITTGTPG